MPGEVWEDSNNEFAKPFVASLKALRQVKREYAPKFDSIYKRKYLGLLWLQDDQDRNGYFSPFGLTKYYDLSDNTWSNKYFSRLIVEGWIIPIHEHMALHRRAVLSPLFFALLQAITNTLRREYPERFKAQDLAALSPEIKAMKPESSVFDFVTAIPDLR